MKAGAGHPMGPLTLADFVGLDTLGSICDVLFEEFRERRFARPPALPQDALRPAGSGASRGWASTTTPARAPGEPGLLGGPSGRGQLSDPGRGLRPRAARRGTARAHARGTADPEEFEERLGSAYRRVTRAELDELRCRPADGRRPTSERSRPAPVEAQAPDASQEAGGALGISGLCVGVWAASGDKRSFWPIWVILVTLAPVDARRLAAVRARLGHEEVEARLAGAQSANGDATAA